MTVFSSWLPCSFSLSLSFLGLARTRSISQDYKPNAQPKASQLAPGGRSGGLAYPLIGLPAWGMAPGWPCSVGWNEGPACQPLEPLARQDAPPSNRFLPPLPSPLRQARGIYRVGGPGTCGWGNSCDGCHQLCCVFTSLLSPRFSVTVQMKHIKPNTITHNVCKDVAKWKQMFT